MEKSDTITKLIQATIKVMSEVKGIDKSMTIGNGANSYKGVPDQEVKKYVGEAMVRNGLTIFTTNIEESTQLDAWDETTNYGVKRKQSVFTKVKVSYLLCHESGEFISLQGIGHGIDSQDKGAGKSMTYSLKTALLYAFLIPTGKIDDTDNTHSDEMATVPKNYYKDASEEMLLATTEAGLKQIWGKYPQLHSDPKFIELGKQQRTLIQQMA